MPSGDSAALGRFVLRTREHLVLIRASEQRPTLTTMRFHDEVRPIPDLMAALEESLAQVK